MGYVIKTPATAEQSRKAAESLRIEMLKAELQEETDTRAAADSDFQNALDATNATLDDEIALRSSETSTLQANLDTESQERKDAIDDLSKKLDDEITTRQSDTYEVKKDLDTAIKKEQQARAGAIDDAIKAIQVAMGDFRALEDIENDTLRDKIADAAKTQAAELENLTEKLNGEIGTRTAEDVKLTAAIADEVKARKAADTNLKSELTKTIDTAKADLEKADTDLQSNITSLQSTLTSTINTLKTNLEKADSDLQGNITSLQGTLTSAINSESKTRQDAVSDLQGTISDLQGSLTAAIENESADRTKALGDLKATLEDKVAAESQTLNSSINSLETSLKKYADNKVTSVEDSLSDFTAPTNSADGKRGFVPAPPKGMLDGILTARGWRKPTESSLTISAAPSQVGSLTYNGSSQSPSWINFDSNKLKISGTTSSTNAGSFTAYFTPIDLYMWADTLNQEARAVSWSIEPMKLPKPSASVTTFTYNGSSQGLTVSNYDSAYITQGGTVSATAANSYSATYSLKNTTNTKWSDGTTGTVTINWKIEAAALNKPSASVKSFTYDGKSHTLSVSGYNPDFMTQSGDISAVDAGTYSVKYSLKNSSTWGDGSTGDVTISWKIEPMKLTKPSASTTSFTYNGSAQSLTISNYDSNYESQTGTVSSTAANSYSVTYKLKNKTNTTWSDGTTADVVINWTINPLKLTKPSASTTSFTYNGSAQSLTISDYNSTYESQTGTVSATAANSYSVTYKLKNTTNTKWADNTTADVTISWTINPLKLTKPSASTTSFEYDGKSHTLSVSGYDSTYMTQSGDVTATEAGDYSVQYALKNTTNTKWADNTTAAVTISWTIEQTQLSEEQSSGFKQSGTLTYTGNSLTPTIKNYNSTLHTLSGETSAINAGTYTLYVSPKEGTWADGTTEPIAVSWTIKKKSITKPTASTTTFTYNGNSQSLTISNYNSSYMTMTGDTAKTAAGSYSVTFSLNSSNVQWSGSSTADVKISWKIEPLKLTKPSAAVTSFNYDGKAHALEVLNYDSTYESQTGTASATAIGDYSVKYTLKNKTNTTWADGTTTDITISWAIVPSKLTQAQSSGFEQSGTLTYSGSSQSPTIKNFDSNYHQKTSDTSKTDAGTYTIYISPKDGLSWYDGTTDPVAVSWKIDKLKLTRPSASTTTFTYNRSTQGLVSQGPTISDYDSTYMTRTGTVSYPDAGDYSITYKLKNTNNTIWADGTTADTVINWSIESLKLPKPSADVTTFTYNGYEQRPTISNYDSDYMTRTGVTSATNVGDKSITYHLTRNNAGAVRDNTTWDDGTTADVTINWEIVPFKVAKPYAEVTSFEYDGKPHTLSVSGYDSTYTTYITREGALTGTEPGNRSVTYSLRSTNYTWEDGTTEPVVINWSIGAYLSIPTISPTSQASAGLTKASTFTISGYDSDKMSYTAKTTYTVSGNTITTKNGVVQTHSITFSLKDKTNTKWSDETTTDKTVSFSVTKKTLSAAESTFPQTKVVKYDGNSHSVTEAVTAIKADYIGEYYNLASDTGTFGTIKTSITPTAAATWSDGTQITKTIEWEIEGTAPDLQLTRDTYNLSIPYSNNYEAAAYAPYTKVNFTTNSTGNLTISSSDKYIAKVTAPGVGETTPTIKASAGYFTVYPRANGVATITVTQAAADGFKAISKTLTVTVTAPCVMLTWGEIQTLTKAGTLLNYMRIGDRVGKQFFDGAYGDNKTGKYIQFMLVGVDHNSGVEGTNRAHFMCTEALIDSNYGKTATEGFIYSLATQAQVSKYHYSASQIRERCTEFYNTMPTALQNAIVACKKYCGVNGDIIYVTDKVWIPSAVEVVGSVTNVRNNNWSTAKQYEYFANGNSRKLGYKYWTRDLSNDGLAIYIDEQGEDVSTDISQTSLGFVPCFTIG